MTRRPQWPRPGALRGLLGPACAVAIAMALACGALACGAQSVKSSAPPSPESTAAAAAPAGDPHAEIAALDREITDELGRAEVAPPPIASCSGAACGAALAEPFAAPATTDATCRPAPSQRCTDVCKLGTSICRNQDRICELARQLPGDDWAANKCTGARASCQAAHERCCSCAP